MKTSMLLVLSVFFMISDIYACAIVDKDNGTYTVDPSGDAQNKSPKRK